MRIYKVLFFLPFLFLISCKNKVPAGILNHEDMKSVLIDVHIVDGHLFNVPSQPDSLFKHSAGFYQQVFVQHHTDSVQFKKSFDYYTNQPDQLFEIYDDIYNTLKAKNDSATVVTAKRDSIARIKQAKIAAQAAKKVADSVKRAAQNKNNPPVKRKPNTDSINKARNLKK
jgi:hypothetical protein